MASFSYRKPKLLAGIVVLNLVLAGIVHFAVLPLLAPSAPNEWSLFAAAAVFIAGLVASLAAVIAAPLVSPAGRSYQEVADAIRHPVILLDSANRYLIFNREAEKLLGLNRERDLGKNADPRLLTTLSDSGGALDIFELRGVAEFNRRHYQVLDNPLPDRGGGNRRILTLIEVENCVRLRQTIQEINQAMLVLSANAAKISGSTVSLSQGATEQATSLAAITSTMNEFSKKIQGNTESAAKGTQLAAQAREAAERSGKEIANALTAMTDVQDAGIRIARIVKLIDDIAFQTNLLALNAAVEAARAGRQGKGFAVVADEVRNLAGRSAKAAKDTASMVEDVTERIGNASAFISKLEEMLRNIVQDAIRMADSSASASATSADQATGILHVNQELGQMNSVTHSTMAAADQTAAAVEALVRQVEGIKGRLQTLGEEFSSGDDPSRAPRTRAINLVDDPDTLAEDARPRSYLESAGYPYQNAGDHYGDTGRRGGAAQTGQGGDDDGDYNPPRRKTKAAPPPAGDDWDLDLDAQQNNGEDSLANLLRSDGYNREYQEFLKTGNKKKVDPFGMKFGPIGKNVPDTSSAEGDRMVKPNQNIVLDDSEFGRY